jgi:hypothetical protein
MDRARNTKQLNDLACPSKNFKGLPENLRKSVSH